MVMVTSRRLTGKTWASRQNYRSRLLAIDKDSNVIGVRSSCLKRRSSDRKKGPLAQTRWKPRAQPRWKTRARLPGLNKTNTTSTNQHDAMRTRKTCMHDGCTRDAHGARKTSLKQNTSKQDNNLILLIYTENHPSLI